MPAASPTGRQIVFVRSFLRPDGIDLGPHIYSMRPDGSRLRDLTPRLGEGALGYPGFSPSGKAIAFATEGNNLRGDIFTMRANGGPIRRLTNRVTHDRRHDGSSAFPGRTVTPTQPSHPPATRSSPSPAAVPAPVLARIRLGDPAPSSPLWLELPRQCSGLGARAKALSRWPQARRSQSAASSAPAQADRLGHREEAEEALGGLLAALDLDRAGGERVVEGELAGEDRGEGGRRRRPRSIAVGSRAAPRPRLELAVRDLDPEALLADPQPVGRAQVPGRLGIEERAQGEDDRVGADLLRVGGKGSGRPRRRAWSRSAPARVPTRSARRPRRPPAAAICDAV